MNIFPHFILYYIFYAKQQPLDQSHTNGNSGFGFGSGLPGLPGGGGQLLSAALGVTKAVTQFLGSALQVSTFQCKNCSFVSIKNI